MDWDLARKGLAITFCVLLIVSGVGPFVDVSPVQEAKASHGGHIYVGEKGGTVQKMTDDGSTTVWSYSFTNYLFDVKAVDGYVYASGDNRVVKLDDTDGSVVWENTDPGGIPRGLAVGTEGTIFAGDTNNNIYKIDSSGTTQWTYTGSAATFYDVAADAEGNVYGFNTDGIVHGVDSTGNQLWTSNSIASTGYAIVAGTNGYLYAGGSSSGGVDKIDTSDGSVVMTYSDHSDSVNDINIDSNGYVYSASSSTVHKWHSSDGTQEWNYTGHSDTVWAVGTDKDGNIYSGADTTYEVHKTDGSDGSQIWNFSPISSRPKGISTDSSFYAARAEQTVSGTVTDKSGNPIENSSVTVKNSSGTQWTGTTDSNGQYTSSDLADGDYTVTASSDGRETKSKTVTISGGGVAADFTLAQVVDGTVVNCEDGKDADRLNLGSSTACPGVSDATVRLMAINYSALDVSPSEYEDRAAEIRAEAQNVTPPEWDNDPTSLTDEYGDATGKYVAVHSKGDWQLRGYTIREIDSAPTIGTDPQLDDPHVQLNEGETAVFSIWDGSKTGILQDGADQDLPGATTDGTVVIQHVGPGGEAIDEPIKIETSKTVKIRSGGNPLGKTHETAATELPAGFYRVHPEGNAERSIVVAVGNPESILNGWRDNLETQAGDLTQQAKDLRQYRNDSKIEFLTTTTDANGKFSISMPNERLEEVSVIAYRTPDGMTADPQNATMRDIRAFYKSSDYNGSFVLPADETYATVPKSGVTVEVREVDAPGYADLNRFQNVTDQFWEYLQNQSYAKAAQVITDNLDKIDDPEKREYLKQLRKMATNPDFRDQYRDNLAEETGDETVTVIKNVDDINSDELQTRISTLEQTIAELRTTIENGEVERTVGQESVSLTFPFETNLEEENVAVLVHYSNGTTDVLSPENSSHVSIENNIGGDAVKVNDYPLGQGDSAVANFDVRVATEDGIGRASESVTNPTFNGTVPALSGIDHSTLNPGPTETVSLSLQPEEGSEFRKLTALSVYAPDGTEAASNITDAQSATFTTEGQGVYHVRATYQNLDGDNFTTTYQLEAANQDRKMPAGIRAVESPVGTYALTGESLSGASINIKEGGSKASITAEIPQEADAPGSIHVYTQGLTLPPDGTVSVNVVRGGDMRAVGQHVGVTVHLSAVPDGTIFYRNDNQPITKDGQTRYGAVESKDGHTVIRSYTDADGRFTLRSNANPSWIDKALWYVRTTVPDVSYSPLSASLPSPGVSIGSVALLGGGLVLVRRRRLN